MDELKELQFLSYFFKDSHILIMFFFLDFGILLVHFPLVLAEGVDLKCLLVNWNLEQEVNEPLSVTQGCTILNGFLFMII